MRKPIIGITMGDAAGIGPELIFKSLQEEEIYQLCRPVVIGSYAAMEFWKTKFSFPNNLRRIEEISGTGPQNNIIDVLDYDLIEPEKIPIGVVDKMCGHAAVIYTQKAGELALNHKIDAIVSAPLNKESMRLAGHEFEGQTQILGELCGAKRYGMILILGHIKVMMLTTHMSLRKACSAVKSGKVLDMLQLADETLKNIGITKPTIAVAALNPHAGEHGLFGDEERDEIAPAISEAKQSGINAVGPVPADVVFVNAKNKMYDLVLAMYHDQANMAAKLLGFGSVVTLLAGLPLIRTSVGHGTAFDIAGKKIAGHNNFLESIKVAARLARQAIQSRQELVK